MRHCCLVVIALAACGGKKSEGLPPATEWNAPAAGQAGTAGMAGTAPMPTADVTTPHAGGMGVAADPNDPHAGLDMGNAGGDLGDMSGGAEGANPHAGQDMSKLGLPPPDPNRPIDPTHRIAGTITVDPKLKALMKDGTPVFLIAKHLDASGAPSGPPVGVEKLTWKGDSIPFELTDHDSMIAGTVLDGTVLVIAHYDTDGDALSKTSGDVLGQVKVTIPADKVAIALDSAIP